MKKFTYLFVFLFGLLLVAGTESFIMPDNADGATIVDIVNVDASINNQTNPVFLEELLGPGTYTVAPTDGGEGFRAWNPWDGEVDLKNNIGWINGFGVELPGDNLQKGDKIQYANPEDALAGALTNGVSITFTLTEATAVGFYLPDPSGVFTDNIGGMTLVLTRVPIPGAIWLMGSGLVALVAVRRKLTGAC